LTSQPIYRTEVSSVDWTAAEWLGWCCVC